MIGMSSYQFSILDNADRDTDAALTARSGFFR